MIEFYFWGITPSRIDLGLFDSGLLNVEAAVAPVTTLK